MSHTPAILAYIQGKLGTKATSNASYPQPKRIEARSQETEFRI